jgi:hypothetical protein
MLKRWARVLVLVLNPLAFADKAWSRIVKILALLGIGRLLFPNSLEAPWRIAIAAVCLMILSFWGCYRLQRELDVPDIEWTIDPTSSAVLSQDPGGNYKIVAQLQLGMKRARMDGDIILKYVELTLCHKSLIRIKQVSSDRIAQVISIGGILVAAKDIGIRTQMSNLMLSHHMHLSIHPSSLNRRHLIKITLHVVGRPNYTIDWTVRWGQAIIGLDPESYFPTATSATTRLRRAPGSDVPQS